MESFFLVSGSVFVIAVALAAYVYAGERREGHARDDD